MAMELGCVLKRLPADLHAAAARTATAINPANAPPPEAARGLVASGVLTPGHLALLTTRWWGADRGVHLPVKFMDGGSAAFKNKLLAVVNRWGDFCNARFSETTGDGAGGVRLLRGPGGYWSYLGTDILHVRGQTMNLEGFTEFTPDSELLRVPPHEFGHSMGFMHEHSRPEIIALLNPPAVIADFERTQGWSEQEIVQQILTPPDEPIEAGPIDVRSIMAYAFAARLTRNGVAIPGGSDFTDLDRALAAKVYPLAVTPPPPPPPPPGGGKKYRVTLDVDAATGAAVVVPAG